jgi:hypothetical protein
MLHVISSTEQNLWEADTNTAGQQIPLFICNRKFNIVIIRACHCSPAWFTHYTFSHSSYLTLISMIHSKDLPVCLFPCKLKKRKGYDRSRPWRPIGLWDVKDPTMFRQSAHRWWQGCQCRHSRTLLPKYIISLLLVLAEWSSRHSAAGRTR